MRANLTLLAGIQGRAQEALRFPTGDGGGRVVQPIVFHHVMDRVTAAAWQIIQRPDGLEVLLVQPHEVDQPVLAASLQAALTAQGVVAPTVRIREVAAIPTGPALGKAPSSRTPTPSGTFPLSLILGWLDLCGRGQFGRTVP